jgi:site-specific DNA recombinase
MERPKSDSRSRLSAVAKNGKQSGGNSFFRGALYSVLSNPIYIGEIRQGCPSSGPARINRGPGAVGRDAAAATKSRSAPCTTSKEVRPKSADWQDVRRKRPEPDAESRRQGRTPVSVLRIAQPYQRTADSTGRGWRLPAPEIERTVAASACQILSDRTAIAAAAQAIGLADHRLPSLFSAAAAWRERLQSEVESAAALNALVDRVDLTDIGVRVSLKVATPEPVTRPAANVHELIIVRFFPMTIRRRGVEMRLVIEGNRAHAPRADSALLKAVARAHQWSEDLLLGRAQSVTEIAEREGVADRYVRRVIRLAFLAPEIVEAIVVGNQPPELTAEALAERIDLPLLWTGQERAVGIA